MLKILPTFKGYTIDARLKQFRKAEIGERIEFIEFDSQEGDDLLVELVKSLSPNVKEEYELLKSLF